jgi:hypothetical protein
MEEQKTNQFEGSLFDTIQYQNSESLEKFLDNLRKEQALLIISEAIRVSYEKGVFDIIESESISRALRLLSKPE